MEYERKPTFLALFRLLLLMVDADQLMTVPRLVVFFVIRRFTRIHKGKKLEVEVRNNGKKRKSACKEIEEVVAAE
jgi:hypothetical protein